ncbi:MAG: hypothetical protein U0176_10260 [Bacteroidia bacterium]
MNRLRFGKNYLGGLKASVDWVAGGNFDGYVYRFRMRFENGNGVVTLEKEVLDKSRYDDEVRPLRLVGEYFETDHSTITCRFPDFSMRGVVTGDRGQYLAFSASRGNDSWTECYQLEKGSWPF